MLPQDLAALGIEREDIIVAGNHIHDAVFDEWSRLERIFATKPGSFEAGHPGSLELLDVTGVDLLQRRIALVGHVAAVGNPVLACRVLKKAVDLLVGSSDRRSPQEQQAESHKNRDHSLCAMPHHLPPVFSLARSQFVLALA